MFNDKENKLSKYEIEETIKSFNYIINGKQSSYPMGFFNGVKGELKLKLIFEHYFFSINNYTEEEVYSKLTGGLLRTLKLEHAVKTVYGTKQIYNIFKTLFPERNTWEFPMIPNKVWTDELKKDFCIWFLEEYNKLSKEKIFDKSFNIKQISTGEGSKREDVVAGKVVRKFTSICDVIATAYDMDKEEVKHLLLGRKK